MNEVNDVVEVDCPHPRLIKALMRRLSNETQAIRKVSHNFETSLFGGEDKPNASDRLYDLIGDAQRLPGLSLPVAVELAQVAQLLISYRIVCGFFLRDDDLKDALAEFEPTHFDALMEDLRHG